MEQLTMRHIDSAVELAKIPAMEQAIWGNNDPVPTSLLRVFTDFGGEVSVAYAPERPNRWLGFTMSFGTYDHLGRLLYSHQTGVLPGFQNQGVGRFLKYQQNRWAEAHGYRRIVWTFDPLRVRNAYFNVAVLGAEITGYYPDYYGVLTSRINRGLPTDRLICEWSVPAPEIPRPDQRIDRKIYLPEDLEQLKSENMQHALRWRETIKAQFLEALQLGYQVVGFSRPPSPAYLLSKPPQTPSGRNPARYPFRS